MGIRPYRLTDIIAVDDRPFDKAKIAEIMRDVPCVPHLFSDISSAFTALLEQVGTRLLVNFQLKSKNYGAFLLRKMDEKNLPVPTIVMDCANDSSKIHQITSGYEFVRYVIDDDCMASCIRQLREVFLTPMQFYRTVEAGRTGTSKVFVIIGRNLHVKDRIVTILSDFVVDPVIGRKGD